MEHDMSVLEEHETTTSTRNGRLYHQWIDQTYL